MARKTKSLTEKSLDEAVKLLNDKFSNFQDYREHVREKFSADTATRILGNLITVAQMIHVEKLKKDK